MTHIFPGIWGYFSKFLDGNGVTVVTAMVFLFPPPAPQRVFSLLKWMFGDQQMSTLADIIQAALMLRYNKRPVRSRLNLWRGLDGGPKGSQLPRGPEGCQGSPEGSRGVPSSTQTGNISGNFSFLSRHGIFLKRF